MDSPRRVTPLAYHRFMDTNVASVRPLEQLEAVIHQGAANLTAFEHDWLLAIAEFDRREGWKLWECQSCAAWLSWQVGLDIRAAHEKVRVARALERFPVIAAAMSTGQVSYSKVRAITRIATPECEQALVDMALAGTTNHVERIVSAYRRAEPIAVEREQVQHARRSVCHRVDDDGSVVITVRLPAEAGATVLSAIEHLVAPSVAEPDGTRDPMSARRADALVDLAIAGHAASSKRRSAPRYLAHLHVSESALSGGDGHCEIHGHGDSLDQPIGISIDTALRMLCDADVDIVVPHEDGNTNGLSRRQGVVRGTRRRQVEERDEHRCQVPGCARRGYLRGAPHQTPSAPRQQQACEPHVDVPISPPPAARGRVACRAHIRRTRATRLSWASDLRAPTHHDRQRQRSRSPRPQTRRWSLQLGRRTPRHQHGARRPVLPHPHSPGSLEEVSHKPDPDLIRRRRRRLLRSSAFRYPGSPIRMGAAPAAQAAVQFA